MLKEPWNELKILCSALQCMWGKPNIQMTISMVVKCVTMTCIHWCNRTFVCYPFCLTFSAPNSRSITAEKTLRKTVACNVQHEKNVVWLCKTDNTMHDAMLKKKNNPRHCSEATGFWQHIQMAELKRPDSTYLIIVVMTVKERLLSEDHAGEHATQTPHVQAVVIHLQIIQRGEKAWAWAFL